MSETPRTDAAMSCKPDEIEGAICDRCGNGIGPFGCCATIDWAVSVISKLYPCSQELERELAAANEALDEQNCPRRYVQQGGVTRCLHGTASITAYEWLEKELGAAEERIAQLTAPGEYGALPEQLRMLADRIADNQPLMSVPVNTDRDGDCLADKAATAIEQLQARVRELQSEVEHYAFRRKEVTKYRKKPVVIEATQWFKNGDHPEDACYYVDDKSPDRYLSEGKIVRYFRRPDIPGTQLCSKCGKAMHDHGWIDTLEDGHSVCPGDWIITGVKGEHYPCKPDIFAMTYERVEP